MVRSEAEFNTGPLLTLTFGISSNIVCTLLLVTFLLKLLALTNKQLINVYFVLLSDTVHNRKVMEVCSIKSVKAVRSCSRWQRSQSVFKYCRSGLFPLATA